ncbi:MAG: hypothetical protein QOE70_3850 [Chthoniobacter sp.]|jgi:hypothetical protein|nr:hypothetical protein [Chthoniobacter sp.]
MRNRWRKIALYAAISAIAYILALGPVAMLCERAIMPERVGAVIFAPIYPLAHIPILRTMIRYYLKLWMMPDSS